MLAKCVPWLGFVLVVAAVLLLRAPHEVSLRRDRIELDPTTFRADSGVAYIVPVDVDGPSDQDGYSEYGLVEDDVPLVGHTRHAAIREQPGYFSHWGGRVWFSATDGSDPRTNGRRYAMLTPPVPRFAESQVWAALLAGSALVALGLLITRGRARVVTGALCVTTAFLVFVGSAPRREAQAWRDVVAAAGEVSAASAVTPPPDAAATAPPRTRHLLAEHRVAFAPGAPAHEAVPDVALAFASAGEPLVLARDEWVALEPHAPLSERDLRLLTVRATVTAGRALTVRAHLTRSEEDEEEFVDVSIPVRPSDVPQDLVVHDVFMHKSGAGRRVERLELGCADADVEGLSLAVHAITATSEWATYAAHTDGRGPITADRDRRLAVWQSVPGTLTLSCAEGTDAARGAEDARGRLRGAVHLAAAEGVASVEVLLLDTEGGVLARHERTAAAGAPWLELDLALPLRCARILLRCDALPERGALCWAGWRTIDTSRPARRVLTVLLDTLRADALACYGNPRVRTPTLDRLAAEGARWARCYSQAHWTRASMPSIMTGHYVPATGVQRLSESLPDAYATLAEAMADAGFYTVSLIANGNAGPAAGLGQGFDELRIDYGQDTAAQLAQSVTPRLERLDVEDLFVYVHAMEIHAPYGPEPRPDGWIEREGTPVERDDRFDRPWVEAPTVESRIALYEHDVESADAALGAFLERWIPAWESGGGPVVVAVLSDHGEFLGEFDTWGHVGIRHVPEVTHVPLIARAPGRLVPGTVIEDVVETRHVGMTLLDLAGARTSVPLAGRSLLGPLAPVAISNCLSGNKGLFTVYGERGALVGVDARLEGRARPGADPLAFDESRVGSVVLGDLDDGFVRLWELYDERQAAIRRALWSDVAAGAPAAEVDAATLQSLREMGYLGY